jgi:hypothetical protein
MLACLVMLAFSALSSWILGKEHAVNMLIVGGVLFVPLLVACFVSGLLGWLLVMRKRILQCNYCNAVVPAS